MAGLVDKLQKMWNPPDDEYEEYYDEPEEQETSSRSSSFGESRRSSTYSFSDFAPRSESSGGNRVVNINAKAQLQVVLFKPISFGEETRPADELLKRHTVVLNLEKTEKEVSRRIVDFLSGVAYANNGKSSVWLPIPSLSRRIMWTSPATTCWMSWKIMASISNGDDQ